jgi:hypothetical protein
MELDDLKNQWAESDKKLDEVIRLNTQVLRDSRMSRTNSSLKWAFRGILFEQLASIPALILLGIFISNRYSEPRYLVPAIVLDLFAIFSVASCGYQLGTLHSIDFGQPVVAIQKKLEKVRVLRLATIKWGLLLGPVLWIPFTIVALKGLLGVDGYALFHGEWLVINLLAGAAISALLFWLSNRFASRTQRSPVLQRLMNDLAGYSLSRALTFLDGISRFEHEDGRA